MALTEPAPRHPRTVWDSPALLRALAEGPAEAPVAAGGGLTPATLIGAYRAGAFPWPVSDPDEAAMLRRALGAAVRGGIIPLLPAEAGGNGAGKDEAAGNAGHDELDPPWWCPDPRAVIPSDGVRVSRSLAQRLRRTTWTTTLDECFETVVRSCRREEPHQWITPELIQGYVELHERNWAHSLEVWDGDELVGGLYGVLVGRVFVGESMFHRRTDASKVALVDFADRFHRAGGVLIDCQLSTPHMASLGAREIPRSRFLDLLWRFRDDEIRMVRDRLPASRLAPPRGRPGRG